MANDPWSYAGTSEHSQQVALFMWANMAEKFGLLIADDPFSYTKAGFAKTQFENAGKLGYKLLSHPVKQLKWLHAVHNQGHGDAIRGAKAKAEGVKAGVSDIFLPVPIRESVYNVYYHGLYIELKAGKNNPTDVQLEFIHDATMAGYCAKVAYGWLEARKIILDYLQI